MKRFFAVLLCISLLLTGCFGGNSEQPQGEKPSLSDLFGGSKDNTPAAEGPQETVSGIPPHIQEWTDPLEGIPEPTTYTVDEELAWAMSLIGMELTPPEDTLEEEAVMPMDGLWNTERTNTYQGSDSLTAENLQDFFAMYAKDAELTVRPPIMEPTPEPLGGAGNDPVEVQKNFADYYNDQSVMIAVFENFVEKHLDIYNEDAELDDSVFLYLMAMYSWELSMGATFTEDTSWANQERGIIMVVEMFGGDNAAVTRNAAHNYTITYTDDDGGTVVDTFRADLEGGIQMLSYTDGELVTFFEFRELGADAYVWQSEQERLLMTYKDKTVLTAYYTSLPEDAAHYTEDDLIFSHDGDFTPDWVSQREDFHTDIRFDGTILEVTTVNFFIGGVGHAVINTAEQ